LALRVAKAIRHPNSKLGEKQMVGRIALGMVAALALTGTAAAADSGFYVGAGLGGTQFKVDDADFKEDYLGGKLFAGFAFNRYFAAELSYFDGEGVEQRVVDPFEDSTLEIDTRGVALSAVGSVPLGERVALFGKVGYAFYHTSIDLRGTDGGDDIGFSDSDDDSDLTFGAGVKVNVTDRFSLQGEYEHLSLDGVADDGELNSYTFSAVLRF
jgi:OmpA-OmpF porin, OOP family